MVSCGRTEEAPDKNRLTGEVRAMLKAYHQAIAEEGLTAELEYLDRSPAFFWVPPGYETALSYDSVSAILKKNATTLRLAEFEWDTLRIFPLTDEIANYSGIVRGRTIDTAGVETKISIIESGTVIKRKDGWKLLSGQSALIR